MDGMIHMVCLPVGNILVNYQFAMAVALNCIFVCQIFGPLHSHTNSGELLSPSSSGPLLTVFLFLPGGIVLKLIVVDRLLTEVHAMSRRR